MRLGGLRRFLRKRLTSFARSERANIAIIFALSLIPLCIAAGAGLDLARAMIVRARLAEALDAAGLAVGGNTGLTQTQLQALAQQYFNANYTNDASYGTPSAVTVDSEGQTVTIAASVNMPTVLVRVADLLGCTTCDTLAISETSQIVWGQTKLWVSLVLDNTGSMCEPDSNPCPGDTNQNIKINALKTATHQLLTILQNAAAHDGDVKVAIVPFSKDVNIGTSNSGASWVDWTSWEAAPTSSTPAATKGPGDSCPYGTNTSPYGYTCQVNPTNGSSSTSTIPSSGTYTGYICPGQDNGKYNTGKNGRYYNGCYTSVDNGTLTTVATGSSATCNGYHNCSCTGSGSSKVCKAHNYNHTWTVNDHSTWGGCIMDRTQDYDTENTTPTNSTTNFPTENAFSCPPGTLGTLSYDWSSLSTQVDAMVAQGSTNQTIGLAWGWQALTDGNPLNAGTLPDDTQQVIILLSDGLNTQDRWYGNGSAQSSSVDGRMNTTCANVKAAHIMIYTVFVDLNGTQGNSTVLQNCASDSSKYYDLKTTGAIVTAFNQIGTAITQLRVLR